MEATVNNTIVVIPSYNEALTIGSIVRDVTGMGFNVLVIDDGSSDNTRAEALDNGAMVIRNKKNLGKGGSIRKGVRHVLEKTNYKWMILMDGDGQHHSEDILVFLEATSNNDVDIVVGNRMTATKNMPTVRYWTNRFTSYITSKICRQKIPDSQCGYRLIRVEALKNVTLSSDNYDIESELLIEVSRAGLKIVSVPVQTIYGDEISEIHPVRDALRFFGLIFRNIGKK